MENAPPLRVMHLDLGMEYRGGQRQVLYLAGEQLRQGYDVRVAAPAGAPVLLEAGKRGLPTLVLPRRFDFHPRNAVFLLKNLLPREILHTHDARAASLGAICAFLRPGLVLMHTRRVSYALGSGWSRWKYRLGRLVICVSREVEERVAAAGVRRTVVIPSAIPLDRFTSLPRRANNGRLGIIGALSPQKGHAQFLRALASMEEPPEIWIVGEGKLGPSLRELAARLGLEERIVWKGWVESPEVMPHLDILVVPSAHGEGSSGVIKEGWAAGVPVVCSDLASNLELVRDGENGLVFENGRPQRLAEQLNRLRREPELAAHLVRNGRESVRAFGIDRMYAAYHQAYHCSASGFALNGARADHIEGV